MTQLLKSLLAPVGALWLALVAAAVWQLCRKQRRRALTPAVAAAAFYALGALPLPGWLVARLERPYAPVPADRLPVADAVVVLGGIGYASTNELLGFNFENPVDRVLTGVELVRRGNARHLVLGGGGPRPGEPGLAEGEHLLRWLSGWGLTNAPVSLLGPCRDTHDEALRTADLCKARKWQRLILVTSALHMRRAEAVFRAAGVPVTPVACDFQALSGVDLSDLSAWIPSQRGLEFSNGYVHETLGWYAYRWRGWVK